MKRNFSFEVSAKLGGASLARAGVIRTPHGEIRTPAFIVVGTRAAVRSMTPEMVSQTGAQAVLGNAYHLYLRPGAQLVDRAGGLGAFMNWPGPTFTDSGGFQVMSLGVGFKKMLAMETSGKASDVIASSKTRLAHVDEDGVSFISHIDGSRHRFSPEVSMRIQHQLGADIMFAFDECTSIMNTRAYQEQSLKRTHRWAHQCLEAHRALTTERSDKPYQALFGVVQGAQYEDLRRESARFMAGLDFDGYGLGGALEKHNLGTIVRWMNEELPSDKPKHLLGISDPTDLFAGIDNGVDTFDCVAPTREARNGAIYSPDGRFNITKAQYREDFGPLVPGCACYACHNYSRAYVHHLFRVGEKMAGTLASVHNEQFIVGLVDNARQAIIDGGYEAFRDGFLSRYSARRPG